VVLDPEVFFRIDVEALLGIVTLQNKSYNVFNISGLICVCIIDIMEYIITIPTYKRYKELNQKTLSTLSRHNIPSNKIYIFVASDEEKSEYEKHISADDYNEMVVGFLGITNQQNFIANYFPKDVYIISMDDDIEKIMKLGNEIENFEELIQSNYGLMIENRCDTWGIYPVNNLFFTKNQKEYTYDFKFIIGCLYGFINNKNYVLNSDCEVKQDYERSVLSYMNCGGIMRCNHISVKTKFYAVGGLGKNRSVDNANAVEYLITTYPLYFCRKFRKNGREELRCRKHLRK
jgi:hypothetical protein